MVGTKLPRCTCRAIPFFSMTLTTYLFQSLEDFIDRPPGLQLRYEHVILYQFQEVVKGIRTAFLAMQISYPLKGTHMSTL